MDTIISSFQLAFSLESMLVIFLASLFGIFMGAIPGLSATMAVALIVPLTFFMDPIPALAAVISASAMAIFAGDIPAALLRMPGTPSSAAYVDDLYEMTRKGHAERGLAACLIFSAIGGVFGTVVLIITAPILAKFASSFSSAEYFWLACLGLSCAVIVFSSSPLKGVIALLIGTLLATVGADLVTGHARYSFGYTPLMAGIAFIPALIGVFALTEIMNTAPERNAPIEQPAQVRNGLFSDSKYLMKEYWVEALRGSAVGTALGVLPGAGGGVTTWISYAMSRRLSKNRTDGPHDPMAGVVEAGASNNSGLGGAWIPTMVFGIPGDAITAVVIGVLLMKGIVPGPGVFTNTPDLAYAIFIIFMLANILMVPFGWLAIRTSGYILRVPKGAMMAVILLVSIIGAFAINNSLFDVVVMGAVGILAFFLQRYGFPLAAIILGLVLAPIVEQNLMISLLKSRGDPIGLVDRPLAAVLGVITVLVWISPLITKWVRSIRAKRAAQA